MRTTCSITFALTLLLPGVSLAGQVILFTDGRTLDVENVVLAADLAEIELEGGGRLAVAASRIANWDELSRQATGRPAVMNAAMAPVSRAPVGDGGGDYHNARGSEADLWRRAAGKWADVLGRAAERYEVDPALLTAVAHVESRFDAAAVSPKGAQGLLQLMPATARRFGVQDSFDVAQNVEGGARYLKWLLERFEGSTELALAGYNAGENAVDRYQGVPPYAETRTYVARVMNQFNRFNQGTTAR